MGKRIALSAVFVITALFIIQGTFAEGCAPRHALGLNGTVLDSDLIILGQKTSQSQPLLGANTNAYTPEWADIKILSVLKGESKSQIIRIKTNLPCKEGLVAPPDENIYLMFFSYDKTADEYTRVSRGYLLGEALYKIENNSFLYYNEDTYSQETTTLDEFISTQGLTPAAPQTLIQQEKDTPTIIPQIDINFEKKSPLLDYIPLTKITIIIAVILIVCLLVAITWYASTKRSD